MVPLGPIVWGFGLGFFVCLGVFCSYCRKLINSLRKLCEIFWLEINIWLSILHGSYWIISHYFCCLTRIDSRLCLLSQVTFSSILFLAVCCLLLPSSKWHLFFLRAGGIILQELTTGFMALSSSRKYAQYVSYLPFADTSLIIVF